MTKPTIPAALVPRILALKPWLGECWPIGLCVHEGRLHPPGAPTSMVGSWFYDLLCMSMVRALQREGMAPYLCPSGDVVVDFKGKSYRFGYPDQLENLLSACEWAQSRTPNPAAGGGD